MCPVIHKFILKLTSLTLSLQLPRKQIYAQTFLTDPFLASLDQELKSTFLSRRRHFHFTAMLNHTTSESGPNRESKNDDYFGRKIQKNTLTVDQV